MTMQDWLPRIFGAWVLAAGFGAGEAAAAIFTVGNDTNCTHGTVQGAINALPAGGTHEIRIKAGSYAAQAIKISGRVLTLRGGYASCPAASATGDSTLSGAGGGRDSVITITGSGNEIKLERLTLTGGDEVHDGYGGGLDFRGAGKVTTASVAITNNYAGYGGGISFTATGPSELILGEDTTILWNQAQFSGGGIRIEGDAVLRMTADRTWVSGNEALGFDPVTSTAKYGYGGAVLVFDGAHAHIASPGYGLAAVIDDNSARYGGGVAVISGDSEVAFTRGTALFLYSTDAQRPVRIESNSASNTGGGVYVQAYDGNIGKLCAWDFGINQNVAQNGSAIYSESRSDVYLNNPHSNTPGTWICGNRPASAVSCTAGGTCNSISGNRAETSGGTATDGVTVLLQDATWFEGHRVAFRGNRGGNVLRAFPKDGNSNDLFNTLFAGNQTSGSLVRNSGPGTLKIENSTFAGNTLGSQVFLSSAAFVLHRSIVWQPGTPILSQSGGSLSVGDLLVHDASTLGGVSPTVRVGDPLFLDPAKGDYRPHAASRAVDFSSTGGGVDLAGNPRGFDLPLVPNTFGSGDLGAYERVDMAPLVRNGEFNGDLRFWSGGSAISYDGSQNQVGPTGSGVLKISGPVAAGGRISSTQCVRIPGPATYLLDAWGKTAGPVTVSTDVAIVGWSLISSDPTGSCSGGVTRFGESFAGRGNAWTQMEPVQIDVSADEWTGLTSLAVHLIAEDRGVTSIDPTAVAYFDGVRLHALPLGDGDRIFADGFELIEN